MAVGFSTDVDFGVVPSSDGYLPYPNPDENGMFVYTATIILANENEFETLRSYHSTVTKISALGGGGLLVIERGRGKKQLRIPLANGTITNYYAILTSITGLARMIDDSYIRAECTWALVETADL